MFLRILHTKSLNPDWARNFLFDTALHNLSFNIFLPENMNILFIQDHIGIKMTDILDELYNLYILAYILLSQFDSRYMF